MTDQRVVPFSIDGAIAQFSKTRDPALRATIVERTAWLARAVARRFADTSEPFDDLCQVAMIGLLKAVEPVDENETRTSDVLDRRVLASMLERLPSGNATILYLRYYHELSQAQIAERVGTSQVHVGRLIATSLTSLREWVEEGAA